MRKESGDVLPLSGWEILAVCTLPIIGKVLLYSVSTALQTAHAGQSIDLAQKQEQFS